MAGGAIIGEIVIRNENIFDTADPKEDNWLFRLANKLHVKTRPWVIRGQLLFRTGDRYDRRLLEESERILRSSSYHYDAWIRPIAFHDGSVDVEVVTRDVWTLKPGFSFGRSGGANSISIKIEDSNFLGWGVGLGISRASTPDRNTSTVFVQADTSPIPGFGPSCCFPKTAMGGRGAHSSSVLFTRWTPVGPPAQISWIM